MANQLQLEILNGGVEAWNRWRQNHPEVQIDLSGADFSHAYLNGADLRYAILRSTIFKGANLNRADLMSANLSGARLNRAGLSEANLSHADLSNANLSDANLGGANLTQANLIRAILTSAKIGRADLTSADLTGADLTGARLSHAALSGATLSRAILIGANLSRATFFNADLSRAYLNSADLVNADLTKADLTKANLAGADLSYANLSGANLLETNLSHANLIGANLIEVNLCKANLMSAVLVKTDLRRAVLNQCRVFGVSAWQLVLEESEQRDLIITDEDEPTITVDDLEVAQFIYLLLNNQKIRQVIDTITSKVVLILGRFTKERKAVLDAIREELRKRDYLPVLFDFDKPDSRDVHETVTTLARLARFVIADVTDPKSIPQELVSIVEQLPSLAVQPLMHRGNEPWGMYDHIARYPWVLGLHYYDGLADLRTSLDDKVIAPAVTKAKELKP